MPKDKVEKTNAMRLLDAKKAVYKEYILPITEAVSGEEAAMLLGVDAKYVYKTLVTVGKSLEHYVFVVPPLRVNSISKKPLKPSAKRISKWCVPKTCFHSRDIFTAVARRSV